MYIQYCQSSILFKKAAVSGLSDRDEILKVKKTKQKNLLHLNVTGCLMRWGRLIVGCCFSMCVWYVYGNSLTWHISFLSVSNHIFLCENARAVETVSAASLFCSCCCVVSQLGSVLEAFCFDWFKCDQGQQFICQWQSNASHLFPFNSSYSRQLLLKMMLRRGISCATFILVLITFKLLHAKWVWLLTNDRLSQTNQLNAEKGAKLKNVNTNSESE